MAKPRPTMRDVIGALKGDGSSPHRAAEVVSPGPVEVVGEHRTGDPLLDLAALPRGENPNVPPELVDLAQAAALAQDAAQEAGLKASTLKKELEDGMKDAGVQQIVLEDRSEPIAFHTSAPGKRMSLKVLKEIVSPQVGDAIWEQVQPGTPKTSLKIPKAGVAEPSD
jgi:hypothetical protein